MKKLTLNLDLLDVQSFTTAEEVPERGTVHGEQQCTCQTNCTCPGCPTCANYNTCDATCPATCPYTCDDASCWSCEYSCWQSCDVTCYTGFCVCDQQP